jgi:excisionase family DNA binding protein
MAARSQQYAVAPQASGQPLHHYRSVAVAQIDHQRLKIPTNLQPESVVAYLRSLRRYLEAKEGAKLIGCHRETFYLLISNGLPAEKRGRRWRIDPIKFAAWLESTGFAPAATPEQAERREKGGRGTGH